MGLGRGEKRTNRTKNLGPSKKKKKKIHRSGDFQKNWLCGSKSKKLPQAPEI